MSTGGFGPGGLSCPGGFPRRIVPSRALKDKATISYPGSLFLVWREGGGGGGGGKETLGGYPGARATQVLP